MRLLKPVKSALAGIAKHFDQRGEFPLPLSWYTAYLGGFHARIFITYLKYRLQFCDQSNVAFFSKVAYWLQFEGEIRNYAHWLRGCVENGVFQVERLSDQIAALSSQVTSTSQVTDEITANKDWQAHQQKLNIDLEWIGEMQQENLLELLGNSPDNHRQRLAFARLKRELPICQMSKKPCRGWDQVAISLDDGQIQIDTGNLPRLGSIQNAFTSRGNQTSAFVLPFATPPRIADLARGVSTEDPIEVAAAVEATLKHRWKQLIKCVQAEQGGRFLGYRLSWLREIHESLAKIISRSPPFQTLLDITQLWGMSVRLHQSRAFFALFYTLEFNSRSWPAFFAPHADSPAAQLTNLYVQKLLALMRIKQHLSSALSTLIQFMKLGRRAFNHPNIRALLVAQTLQIIWWGVIHWYRAHLDQIRALQRANERFDRSIQTYLKNPCLIKSDFEDLLYQVLVSRLGVLRAVCIAQRLQLKCPISLNYLFQRDEMVFLDTNSRQLYDAKSLERHMQKKPICPLTGSTPRAMIYPFRDSNWLQQINVREHERLDDEQISRLEDLKVKRADEFLTVWQSEEVRLDNQLNAGSLATQSNR